MEVISCTRECVFYDVARVARINMEIQGFQCVRVQQGFVGVGELSLVQTFYLLDGVEITIQNHLHSSELNRRKGYVVNRVNASVKVVIQLTEITTS